MEFAIAKVSTKGQIVIPIPLRKGIASGDEFLIVKDDSRIIMKNVKALANELKEDLMFAEKVEKSWLEHYKGRFVTKTKEEFLKELRKC